MAKDPATLWYWNDWIGGTMIMTRQAKGAYMDLLTAQFNSGHLTETQIKTLLGQDQGLWVTVLREKFLVDGDGKYYNKRLNDEIEKRRENSRKQTDKVNKRWKKNPGNTVVSTEPIPKIESENEDENKIEVGSFGKFENLLTEIEIGAAIEFISITANQTLTEAEINKYFKAFLIHSEGKPYNNRSDKTQHFRTWLKIQIETKPKNGTHQQALRKNSGKSEGAEQLANSLKADLGTGEGNYQE